MQASVVHLELCNVSVPQKKRDGFEELIFTFDPIKDSTMLIIHQSLVAGSGSVLVIKHQCECRSLTSPELLCVSLEVF